MFRLPFKVYEAVISLKKLNVIKQNEILFKVRDFLLKSSPARHIKYKVIDFAHHNKSIMAYKLP